MGARLGVAQALPAEPASFEGQAWPGPVSTAVEAQAVPGVRAVPSDVVAIAPDEPAAAQAWSQAALEAELAYFQVVPA